MAGLELSQNHKDAHLAQTAHSETTARKHYQNKYIEYFLSTWICGWIFSCFEHFLNKPVCLTFCVFHFLSTQTVNAF